MLILITLSCQIFRISLVLNIIMSSVLEACAQHMRNICYAHANTYDGQLSTRMLIAYANANIYDID